MSKPPPPSLYAAVNDVEAHLSNASADFEAICGSIEEVLRQVGFEPQYLAGAVFDTGPRRDKPFRTRVYRLVPNGPSQKSSYLVTLSRVGTGRVVPHPGAQYVPLCLQAIVAGHLPREERELAEFAWHSLPRDMTADDVQSAAARNLDQGADVGLAMLNELRQSRQKATAAT
jgi:hypothetical protein